MTAILLSSRKCLPCKLLKRDLERYGIKLKEIDIESPEGQKLAIEKGIRGIPAIIDKGKIVMIGYNKEKVKEFARNYYSQIFI